MPLEIVLLMSWAGFAIFDYLEDRLPILIAVHHMDHSHRHHTDQSVGIADKQVRDYNLIFVTGPIADFKCLD